MTGTCDLLSYSCDTTEIQFRPTMMFTCRSYTFKIRNTSTVMMNYTTMLGHQRESNIWEPGYFSVSSKTGVVQPGCDEVLTVRYQPTEVQPSEDQRVLQIRID